MEELISKYIKKKGYTFSVETALRYRKSYDAGFYIHGSVKDVIKNCILKEEAKQVSDYYRNRVKIQPMDEG